METTPIAVDGILFVTGPRNSAMALDARTGKQIWRYQRRLPTDIHTQCTVMTNRGLAILGDRVYMATLDAHLVALDAKTGNVIWDKAVGDYKVGLTITLAPLAIDGAVIVGVTAGECALTGYVDAYNPDTGARLWQAAVIPPKGASRRARPGPATPRIIGGGPTWMTGTYDASNRTLYWTTGNPSPDYNGEVRKGDNLYTCSVLAIDPKTGKLKWHFQFTPHDTHDWDAQETPVLIDDVWKGRKRQLLIHADRNAFFYVLDRDTGEFLAGAPFAKQTWAKGLDDTRRPIVIPGTDPTPAGVYVCPDAAGATNWAAPPGIRAQNCCMSGPRLVRHIHEQHDEARSRQTLRRFRPERDFRRTRSRYSRNRSADIQSSLGLQTEPGLIRGGSSRHCGRSGVCRLTRG